MGEHTPAVRSRRLWARAGAPRQAVVLVLLIAVAFSAAVYMGVRHPYQQQQSVPVEPLRSSVIPLAPGGKVPGGRAAALLADSPASGFDSGAKGVTLPAPRRTADFSESQTTTALTTAKEYLVESAVDPGVLGGSTVQPVRLLLDPAQLDQFDRSLAHPVADGRHAATGWLVRFDPGEVVLAGQPVRVSGTLSISESSPMTLEVTADHTYVYAVQSADERGSSHASLFVVRREMRFRFDRDDLRDHHIEVVHSAVQAGPESCTPDASAYLRPLLAGQSAKEDEPAGTDPYSSGRPASSLCGVLAPAAEPSLR
jgi:hypothetical protein